MFDVIVDGTALGWVDVGAFPISVKIALNDVTGKVHYIIEKARRNPCSWRSR